MPEGDKQEKERFNLYLCHSCYACFHSCFAHHLQYTLTGCMLLGMQKKGLQIQTQMRVGEKYQELDIDTLVRTLFYLVYDETLENSSDKFRITFNY